MAKYCKQKLQVRKKRVGKNIANDNKPSSTNAKSQVFAKTLSEQEYFQRKQDRKREKSEQRRAKVKKHHCESMFECHKCKGKNVTYKEQALRSADEGMVYICTCRDCGTTFALSS